MQVPQINNYYGNNTAFQAKLKVEGSANLLPSGAMKRLKQKADLIGTDLGLVKLNLAEEVGKESVANTKIVMSHACPSIRSFDASTERVISGTENQRKIGTFRVISRYLDSIKEQYVLLTKDGQKLN